MFRFKSSVCSVCSGRIYLGLNRLEFRFKSGVVCSGRLCLGLNHLEFRFKSGVVNIQDEYI